MIALSPVSDDLWQAFAPLLPKESPKPWSGRPRVPSGAALGSILFVLRTGWPRLRDWQAAGVREWLPERLLNWLGDEATSRPREARWSCRPRAAPSPPPRNL
jgi:hypothetical protein